MDVHCSSCNEPWDTHHLSEEAIFDTKLTAEEAKEWVALPSSARLSEPHRRKFRDAGWEFGLSLMNVIHCPCCPAGAVPDVERMLAKAALEELMGDDLDGIAATMEDFGL